MINEQTSLEILRQRGSAACSHRGNSFEAAPWTKVQKGLVGVLQKESHCFTPGMEPNDEPQQGTELWGYQLAKWWQ